MKWIGIHGASESGKDTAADFIIAEFGGEKISFADPMKHLCRGVLGFTQEQLWGPSKNRNAKDTRFSGEERAATCAVVRVRLREQGGPWISQVLPHFGPDKQIEAFHALQMWLEDCLRQDGLTPRYALQTLGTEWGRAQDPEMWFKFAEASAIKRDVQGYCVVADCRFLNEGKFMQSKGAPLIEVLRPGFDGGSAMAAGVAAHQSEMERVKNADAFRQYVTHTIHNDSTLDAFKERIWGVLSPEVPWAGKPTKQLIVPMSSTITAQDTVVTVDSSPSMSSIEEVTTSSSPTSTPESSGSSPTIPTGKQKKFFGSGQKTTPGKTGGNGPKTEPKN
jgi:hypothetical protein